jgi:SPP1 gp7 family putative phage head morphogenesis protein
MTNTAIFDDAIQLQLDLLAAVAGVENEIIGILRALERDLVARLGGDNLTEWGRARTQRQLSEARELIRDYYTQVRDLSLAASSAAVTTTAASIATTLTVAAGTAGKLSDGFLRALASNVIVLGAPQSEWWNRQSADTVFRFAATVRQGIAAGDANQTIIRRIMDFMNVSRANAAALVQTSVQSVSNEARMEMFRANSDIIKRLRAVATLDSSTCAVCAPMDGLEWTIDGKPIGGHGYDFPHYPKHFSCRCGIISQVFDTPPSGERAARGGPVPASMTFDDWLARQPDSEVVAFFGKGRAELYKAGKITINDLTNKSGKTLTLDQLRAKYDK